MSRRFFDIRHPLPECSPLAKTSVSPGRHNRVIVSEGNIYITQPGKLSDFVATHLNIELTEMQGLLETLNVKERLQKVTVLLTRELEVLELGSKIQNLIKDEM